MNKATYLQRINYRGSHHPDFQTLKALQAAHLQTVPFENLDIHLGRPIRLNVPSLFDKIVHQRRGGFCYELNGLFAWLLKEMGFHVTYLSASDAHNDGSFGPEFDHLALLVKYPGEKIAQGYLVDVGWGDTFEEPLKMADAGVQEQGLRAYRIESHGDYHLLWQRNYDASWERQYRFTLQSRRYSDFAEMCAFHQISPQSPFTRKRICTLATPNGRITLDDTHLITTQHGNRQERVIICEHEYQSILQTQFGVRFSRSL